MLYELKNKKKIIMVIQFLISDEMTNPSPTSPNEKKRAVIIDLISDSDEDSNPSQSSNKKPNTGVTTPQKSQTGANSAISSTSESPELMIIDLE